MNATREDVIKAREVVAGYKEFNKNTVETVSKYDPFMKVWTFEKKTIDPNAGEFKKKFIKSPRKEKTINTKTTKQAKPKVKLKKAKKLAVEKLPAPKKNIVAKTIKKLTNKDFDQTTFISKAYNYYLQGDNNATIALKMGRTKRSIITMLRQRDRQLGIQIEKNESYDKIVELVKKGKSVAEISRIMNMTDHNVSYHIKNYNDSKSPAEIELEYKEILSAIKRKANINQVDYCYSRWINQPNCRMKSNLTTPTRNKKCRELVAKGRLIEDKEVTSLKYGIMYRIPKNK